MADEPLPDDTLRAETIAILEEAKAGKIRVERDSRGWLVAGVIYGSGAAGHTGIDPNTSDDPRDMARRLIENTSPTKPPPVPPAEPAAPDEALAAEQATPQSSPDPVPAGEPVATADVAAAGDVSPPAAEPAAGEGVSYPAGAGIMIDVDRRRAELSDALTAEYQNRLAPVKAKKGDANAEIVRLSNLPERTDEDTARLNELHDQVRGYDELLIALAEYLATMQSAVARKSEAELSAFDASFGWPG